MGNDLWGHLKLAFTDVFIGIIVFMFGLMIAAFAIVLLFPPTQ